MKRIFLAIVFLFSMLQAALAQEGGWQVQILGGMFAPFDEEVQNIYGSAPSLEVALMTPVGRSSRARIWTSFTGRKGDPYYLTDDFYAGNVAELRWFNVGLWLETSSPRAVHPKVFVGGGMYYVFGREKITRVSNNRGDGLGVLLGVTTDFPLSRRLSLAMQANFRFQEMVFRQRKNRYRFNLSGGNVSMGFAYWFK